MYLYTVLAQHISKNRGRCLIVLFNCLLYLWLRVPVLLELWIQNMHVDSFPLSALYLLLTLACFAFVARVKLEFTHIVCLYLIWLCHSQYICNDKLLNICNCQCRSSAWRMMRRRLWQSSAEGLCIISWATTSLKGHSNWLSWFHPGKTLSLTAHLLIDSQSFLISSQVPLLVPSWAWKRKVS